MKTKKPTSSVTFTQKQLMLVQKKYGDQNRLIFSVMLKFFEKHGHFYLKNGLDLKQLIIDSATYLELDAKLLIASNYDWDAKSMDRFKQKIRFFFGFRAATLADKTAFIDYCKKTIFVARPTWDQALEDGYKYFKMKKLEPYSNKQLERFLTTAHHQFEFELCENITRSLSLETKNKLDQLLIHFDNDDVPFKRTKQTINESPVNFAHLKSQRVDLKNYLILQPFE